MKLSGIRSHPLYRSDYSTYEVRVNGVILRDCVFADDEAGRAIYLVRDPVDNIIRPNIAGTDPMMAETTGKVVIKKTSLPLTERYTDAFLALFQKNKMPIIRPN